jgi:hypothetical protein
MVKLSIIFLSIFAGCSQVKIAETPEITFTQENDIVYTKSQLAFIKDAVSCANIVAKSPEFKKAVLISQFEQTKQSPEEIYIVMTNGAMSEVKPIYPVNRFTGMTATTFSNDPAIYLNARKARSKALWTGSVLHEHSHKKGYLHRGNTRAGNEKSVPYVLGDIGEKLAYLCK